MQSTLRDDGHAVAQQVGFIHVVCGENYRTTCAIPNTYTFHTSTQSMMQQHLQDDTKYFGESMVIVPERYFNSKSQMERLEYGSTPDVGSSRNTTFAPPTKAIAMESFLCIPPTQSEKTITKR